jgi:hypothetical protein
MPMAAVYVLENRWIFGRFLVILLQIPPWTKRHFFHFGHKNQICLKKETFPSIKNSPSIHRRFVRVSFLPFPFANFVSIPPSLVKGGNPIGPIWGKREKKAAGDRHIEKRGGLADKNK